MDSAPARVNITDELMAGGQRIRFRPAQESDRAFLQRVYASSREEELALVPWSQEEKEAFLQMQFQAQDKYYHAHYTGAEFLIIATPVESIGRLYLLRSEKEIRIMDITLLPAWRNRGIGAALLGQLLTEAEATQRIASIHVEVFNPARRLYQRLGFKEAAQKGVYILMEWSPPPTG